MKQAPQQDRRLALPDGAHEMAAYLSTGLPVGALYGFERDDYDALRMVGEQLLRAGRSDEALPVLGELVMLQPLERRNLEALGHALRSQGRHEEALHFYNLSSMLDMEDPLPTFLCCECLIQLGRLDKAAEGLELVLEDCQRNGQKDLSRRAQGLLDLVRKGALTHPGTPS